MKHELLNLLHARRGHFKLESGHHGDLWLDLHSLFLNPTRLQPIVAELAARLSNHHIGAVCGPMSGGAFLAQMIAERLDVDFYFAERITDPRVDYRIPAALRNHLRDQRVAIVDDAINAGSAVRATIAVIRTCGAIPAALGALIVLGTSASHLAAEMNLPLEALASVPSKLWEPGTCPLCASGMPLEER